MSSQRMKRPAPKAVSSTRANWEVTTAALMSWKNLVMKPNIDSDVSADCSTRVWMGVGVVKNVQVGKIAQGEEGDGEGEKREDDI